MLKAVITYKTTFKCLQDDVDVITWRTALMVEVEVQLKAGRAMALSRQYSNNLSRLAPVTTPAGTMPCRPILEERFGWS